MGLTGLLALAAICFFWGVNQTIADTQTAVDTQTAIDQANKTGAQRRHDARMLLEQALNNGMQPGMTPESLLNLPIPLDTAPKATVLKAAAAKKHN
jgi:hypothetical protein